jgi:hypothetical protein
MLLGHLPPQVERLTLTTVMKHFGSELLLLIQVE